MQSKKTPAKKKDRYYQLYELFQSISSTLDPQQALNLIIDAAVKITGATTASLILVDWESKILNIKVSRGFVKHIENLKLKVGEGITGWVVENGQPLLIPDVSQDSRYVQVNKNIKSELAVPLTNEDLIIGVVNVDSTRLNAFDVDDVNLLTLLSKQSAQMIKNGQLFDTAKRKVEELSTLIEMNKAVASSLSLQNILDQVVQRTSELMRSKICSVMLLSQQKDRLLLKAHFGGSSEFLQNQVFFVQDSIVGQVIHSRKPLQVLDVRKEEQFKDKEFAQREGLHSLLSVPLTVKNEIIGAINIYKSKPYCFADEEITLLTSLADLCAIAIENARIHENVVTLEEQIRQADRLAAVGELAAGVAHEIRNPLTVIKMIFDSGSSLSGKDIQVIREELDRMNKIVAHLLDFAKPRDPVRESCNLNSILNNVLLLLSHEVSQRKIQISTKLDPNLPDIFVDSIQMQQVFLNLLLNSIEALEDGGNLRVNSKKVNPEWLEVVIEDDGSGIPRSIQKDLFTPFQTGKTSGLGLGLSIVKRIVEAHNGTINLKSSNRKGTQVLVGLPLLMQGN